IKSIGHVEIAGAIQRDAGRRIKTCGAATAIRAAVHARGTGNGCNHSGGSNLSDGTVNLIRHVDVAGAVDGNSPGLPELRSAAGPIGAPVDARCASQGGHDPGRSDFADGIGEIGDVDIARAIHSNAKHITETSVTACSVSRSILSSESRYRGDYPGRRNLAHRVVLGIG